MTKALALALAAGAALLAAACTPAVTAPMDPGICYHVAATSEGKVRFNKVAEDIADLEHCAAALERMRIGFLRMGGGNPDIDGAFQGKFIFLRQEGISVGKRLDGPRYMALVRYGDKLVMPGAIVQER